ncbi:MAG: hypothetical protein A2486_12770 [Burkholderiales bacterium RIFOXYC12_FULL_65_23]|nr:MAG: hypothetical protein A2486_12770 [Burkholderiales bacterium RIFOXYC12_FULL_65_23]
MLSQVRQSARCAALLSQRGRATWLSASSHCTKGKKAMVAAAGSSGWRQVSRVKKESLPQAQ